MVKDEKGIFQSGLSGGLKGGESGEEGGTEKERGVSKVKSVLIQALDLPIINK